MSVISQPVTLASVQNWILNGAGGSRMVYHVGQLTKDRNARPELNAVAAALLDAAGCDPRHDNTRSRPVMVYLVQRRVYRPHRRLSDQFEYIAVHAAPPYDRHTWINSTGSTA